MVIYSSVKISILFFHPFCLFIFAMLSSFLKEGFSIFNFPFGGMSMVFPSYILSFLFLSIVLSETVEGFIAPLHAVGEVSQFYLMLRGFLILLGDQVG